MKLNLLMLNNLPVFNSYGVLLIDVSLEVWELILVAFLIENQTEKRKKNGTKGGT